MTEIEAAGGGLQAREGAVWGKGGGRHLLLLPVVACGQGGWLGLIVVGVRVGV